MSENSKFILNAEKEYIKEPNKFGFAFWKYRELIKSGEIYQEEYNGVTHNYAINKNRLVYYWSEDNEIIIPDKQLQELDLLYVHEKYAKSIAKLEKTHTINMGNALIYCDRESEEEVVQGYYACAFDFKSDKDFKDAAYIISNSSKDAKIKISASRIKKLTEQPVFDESLWILIRESGTNKAVAIGICIYDSQTRETELEWIYVLHDFQGRKIGSMLIAEIVKRAKFKSDIIRVGGVADGFYEKCGFSSKTDEWLWVKKNGASSGWWE